MSQTPDNDPFRDVLNVASHELAGYFPGMPELIQELNYQDLGRVIERVRYPKQQGLLNLLITGPEPAELEHEMMGYALPRNHEQSQHLVLLANGHIYGIEIDNDSASAKAYKESFASAADPFVITADNLPEAERNLTYNARAWGIKTDSIITNTDPAQVNEVHAAIGQAVTISREVKQAKDRAIAETAGRLISEFSNLLNPQPHKQEPEA